jgi:hypothetical protein
MISRVGNRIPFFAPNRARLCRPLSCCTTANTPHHPDMNANWTNVSVTGALNAFRICFAELFDRALDIYHNRHKNTNFICVDVRDSRSLNSGKDVDTADSGVEEGIASRPAVRVAFGDAGMGDSKGRNLKRQRMG